MSVEKSDINLMSVQIGRKMVVKLTFPRLKDRMLRQRMLRAENL